jgi:tight adherence protein C
MTDVVPLVVAAMSFGCVAIVVFVVGRHLSSQVAMRRRLPIPTAASGSADLSGNIVPNSLLASLVERLDEKRFGIEGPIRTKLRRDLIKAGFFFDYTIRLYILTRLVLVLVLPTFAYIYTEIFFSEVSSYMKIGVAAVTALIAVIGPDAYIRRRQRVLQQEYRLTFPDFVDMLVVCTDAGLSLNAAFARVEPEISKQSRALATNVMLFGAETRTGRSMSDALGTFADRLDLDEVRAFVILLRQSVELGTDIGEALRVYSNEMRAKRLLRAEETANKLPVKMVLPLGVFIFPVILTLILLPVILRLTAAVGGMGR